jgi:hypothetical protein
LRSLFRERRELFLFFSFSALSPYYKAAAILSEMETDGPETKLIKLSKSSSHKRTHLAYITHLSFQKVRKLRAKVTNSFSHAEHIRERFSNVVLASFDSRLSFLLVLRARLEKEKF